MFRAEGGERETLACQGAHRECYHWLPVVTSSYQRLPAVTSSYQRLPVVRSSSSQDVGRTSWKMSLDLNGSEGEFMSVSWLSFFFV